MTSERTEPGTTWLAAATTGGLPEPGRIRWQPLRVGIVGLWEYDEAEFWFADGRLVLRGGNGAGKTKVLELTTLMLLRGEITPSVLDPFGSQHRTMRFNLLPTGEGDDPRAPADSGLGYAWVEFGRRDETGAARYFVCGMGASARRGTGSQPVTTWHFVTVRRPGKDFALLTGGRAIEEKDLKKIDGVTVPGTAAAYRARLAEELFGLSGESYDNLTELLKQLRKPKLGERLNPASLAETLRAALPPLSGHEITQLADGWDHLEQLRRAVEQTESAATAVARFVSGGWRPWGRVVVRRRADEFAAATTTLDNTTRDKNRAQDVLEKAQSDVRTATGRLAESRQAKQDQTTELRELLDSQPYQDAVAAAERVEGLRRVVAGLTEQTAAARARQGREQVALNEARRQAGEAQREVGKAEEKVRGLESALRSAADSCGLEASADRHLPTRDVEALSADFGTRADRFRTLRELHTEYGEIERRAERSGHEVESAERALATASGDEREARAEAERQVGALREQIRDWAAQSGVARCPAELVEEWCDQVAELTVIDTETGTVHAGASPTEAMRTHVTAVRDGLAARAEQLRLRRSPLQGRHDEATAELTAVREQVTGSPPEPTSWKRRERPEIDDLRGAPLWRLVNPVNGIDQDLLARLEAALTASGLLDAWVTSDGHLAARDGVPVADVQPVIGEVPSEPSLLAVLEADSAGGVDSDVVRRLLAGIGWRGTSRTDGARGYWLAADGGWRVGGLVGRAEPTGPAVYLGAAAREAARQRETVRLETELSALDDELAQMDGVLSGIEHAVAQLAEHSGRIPVRAERTLAAAVATLAERIRRRLADESGLRGAREKRDADLVRRDEAWARFADYAGMHRFGLRDLDGQATALQDFRSCLASMIGELDVLAARQDTLESLAAVVEQRERDHQAVEAEVSDLDGKLRRAAVQLSTAESVLGTDHQAQLRRREELDARGTDLETRIEELSESLSEAKASVARAEEVLDKHEERRAVAEQSRDFAMAALWATVDAGLAEPVGLTPPERHSVQSAREFAATARRELAVPAQAADEERLWRRCYRQLEELRQNLLPDRDARVLDEADGSEGEGAAAAWGIQQVVILGDPDRGWQAPHHAADALAARVRLQQAGYDTEQQRVLTTLLGSTFIEHLKERLDYTAHTFAKINNRLAGHPTRQGHVVRVDWAADPADPDAGPVVAALGRGYDELSSGRQELVRAFLARKIAEARKDASAEGVADWKAQLAQALDYREWLRLSLKYRLGAGGAWAAFDSARHAAKSGGEKVVLLSQPLFAAAVVAYDAAGPHAPRWVWLDEAMTGVDTAVKASFMGLTVDFELDVMLTAHDEWCTYPEVPAVAVYDLARERHLPGVDAMPYLWCSGTLTQVDVDRLGLSVEAEPVMAEGLFGAYDDD
ncbi:TIGR02680 family protein [Streptomyces sp. NPDC002680]|uniref:TIGR02680 family protein n=1 Tax=Streptomyces sp. NPDC002680 TaxID=3364659 RepID=UPI0036D1ADA9